MGVKNKWHKYIGTVLVIMALVAGASCNQNTDEDNGEGGSENSTYTLTIRTAGDGSGSIYVNGNSITIPYQEEFEKGTEVEIKASADWGSRFVSWGGSLNSSENTINIMMDEDYDLVAYFVGSNENTYTVTVQKSGSGASYGYVYSIPGGISCGSDCAGEFGENDTIKIIAEASSSNVVFDGFGGDTLKTNHDTAYVIVDADKNVIANFRNTQVTTYTLSVSKIGLGFVRSDPPGISCGLDCSEDYESGTSVTLTAVPDPGYLFDHWSGGCTGTSVNCVVQMDASKSVVAHFVEQPPIYFTHFDTNPFDSGWSYGPGNTSGASLGYGNSMIFAQSYGSGSGWHGVEIVHDLDTTIYLAQDNFELSAYIVASSTAREQEGEVVIDLLDEYNASVVQLWWYDDDYYREEGHIGYTMPDGSGYEFHDYPSFNGVLNLRKKGDTYEFAINDGDAMHSEAVSSSRVIKKIRIRLLTYEDRVPVNTLKVDWVKVKWLPY